MDYKVKIQMANPSFDLNRYYQNIVLKDDFGKMPSKVGHNRGSEEYLKNTTFLLLCLK